MIFIGIDPGLKGAIAFCNDANESIGIISMPIDGGKLCIDSIDGMIKALVRNSRGGVDKAFCFIEKAGVMPGQGIVSCYTIGYGYGALMGLLSANDVGVKEVRPSKWKEVMGINLGAGANKKDKKAASIKLAKKLYPNVSLRPTAKSRVDSDGYAEALLLMHCARQYKEFEG